MQVVIVDDGSNQRIAHMIRADSAIRNLKLPSQFAVADVDRGVSWIDDDLATKNVLRD